MFGQGVASSAFNPLPRQNSARPESAPRRSDPSTGSDTPAHLSRALPDTGSARALPTLVRRTSVSKRLTRQRAVLLRHSAGIFLYLVSVSLVATAIIGVFFGTGFLLLVRPYATEISSFDAGDRRTEVKPLVYGLAPPSDSDHWSMDGHRPTDGKLVSVAAKTSLPTSAEAAVSSVGLAPPAVPDGAMLPERNNAARISAALGLAGEMQTSATRDILPSAEVQPAGSTVTAITPAPSEAVSDPAPSSFAPPALASPNPRLSAAEVSDLLGHGDALLRTGDVASARLFYERAAAAGDGRAALRLGVTFDPAFLGRAGLRNVQGDAAEAQSWYSRAFDLGAAEAKHQLNSLETKQGR